MRKETCLSALISLTCLQVLQLSPASALSLRASGMDAFDASFSIPIPTQHTPDNVEGRTLLRFDPVVGSDVRISAGTVILDSVPGRSVKLTLTGTEGSDGTFGTPDDQPFEVISSGTRGRLSFNFNTDQRMLLDQPAFISAQLTGSFTYDRSIIRGGANLSASAFGNPPPVVVFAAFNAVPGSYDVMRGPFATQTSLTSLTGTLDFSFGLSSELWFA